MTTTLNNLKTVENVNSQSNTRNDRWIPLECNPEVFNSWAHQVGLDTARDQFVDIYGLDDDLLSIIPKPTKAVILLFPVNPGIQAKRVEQDERITKEGQHPLDETLFFVKQNISNACGTMALIHAIANSDVTYVPGGPLQTFIGNCKDKTPEERGQFLASTNLFAKVHLESSALGQTPQPTSDENGMNTDMHFSVFVAAPDKEYRGKELAGAGASGATSDAIPPQAQDVWTPAKLTLLPMRALVPSDGAPAEDLLEGMRLIELDGRRPFPVDHGSCTDVLEDAINVIKKHYLSQVESVYFSMMAFGAAPLPNSPFN